MTESINRLTNMCCAGCRGGQRMLGLAMTESNNRLTNMCCAGCRGGQRMLGLAMTESINRLTNMCCEGCRGGQRMLGLAMTESINRLTNMCCAGCRGGPRMLGLAITEPINQSIKKHVLRRLPRWAAGAWASSRETPAWPRSCRSRGSTLAAESLAPPSPRRMDTSSGRSHQATTTGKCRRRLASLWKGINCIGAHPFLLSSYCTS
jgi:hypothetical protein